MATEKNSSTEARPFTRWIRGMEDDPNFILVVDNPEGGNPLEWRQLDIRALPGRPDLQARMSDRTRGRMLREAEQAERELFGLPLVDETVDYGSAEYVNIPITLVRANCRGVGE